MFGTIILSVYTDSSTGGLKLLTKNKSDKRTINHYKSVFYI